METTNSKINTVRVLDRISLLFILATFLILPFIFFGNSITTPPLELMKISLLTFGIAVALGLWAVARSKEGTVALPRNLLSLSFIAMILIFFLSSVFSGSFLFSFLGYGTESTASGFWLLGGLLIIMSMTLFGSRSNLKLTFRALGLGAGLLILFSFLSGVARVFGLKHAINPIGLWSDAVIIVGLAILLLAYMIPLIQLTLVKKIVAYVFLVLGLVTAIITGLHFTAFWYVGAVLSLILILLSFQQSKKIPYLLLVLFVISLFIAIAPKTIAKISPKYFAVSFEDRVVSTWKITKQVGLATIKDGPVLGTGTNTYLRQFLLHRPAADLLGSLRNQDYWYGIGIMPTLMATTGVLGILGILFFLGMLVWKSLQSIFPSSRPEDSAISMETQLVGVSALFLFTMLVLHASGAVVVALALLLTAIFAALISKRGKVINLESSGFKFGKIISPLLLLIVLVVALLYATGIGRRIISAIYFTQGLAIYQNQKDVEATEKKFLRAASIYPSDAYYRSLTGLESGYLASLINSTDPKVDKTTDEFKNKAVTAFKKSADYANRAVAADKKNYLNYVTLGKLAEASIYLGVSDGLTTAQNSYALALKLYPSNASIASALKRLDEAKKATVAPAKPAVTSPTPVKKK